MKSYIGFTYVPKFVFAFFIRENEFSILYHCQFLIDHSFKAPS